DNYLLILRLRSKTNHLKRWQGFEAQKAKRGPQNTTCCYHVITKIFPIVRLQKQAVWLYPLSVYQLQNYRQ
ncbi:hypothetical protein, partial [Bacteroides congonensis]|uniref:hypothetical protein n=1 Tax=Bacteroides congonensis TaxID=1871006 RepID=UPI002676B4E9